MNPIYKEEDCAFVVRIGMSCDCTEGFQTENIRSSKAEMYSTKSSCSSTGKQNEEACACCKKLESSVCTQLVDITHEGFQIHRK
jgi:hypothetical protein